MNGPALLSHSLSTKWLKNGTWLVSEFTGNSFVHTALLYPFLELYQRGMGATVLLGSEDTYCTNGAAGVCGCIGLSDETQIFHE